MLGMKVLIAERKMIIVERHPTAVIVPFEYVLRCCTVIFFAVTILDATRILLSVLEFKEVSPNAGLVDVSEKGVVDENAPPQAL